MPLQDLQVPAREAVAMEEIVALHFVWKERTQNM